MLRMRRWSVCPGRPALHAADAAHDHVGGHPAWDASTIAKQLWDILQLQLADNVNAREMRPDGSYAKVKPAEGQPLVDSQMELYNYFKDGFTATAPAAPRQKWARQGSAGLRRLLEQAAQLAAPRLNRIARWKSRTPLQVFGFFLRKIAIESTCKAILLNRLKSWENVAFCLILSQKPYSMGV